MSFNAAAGAALSGVPLLALRRPGWSPGPGDDWRFAGSSPRRPHDCRNSAAGPS